MDTTYNHLVNSDEITRTIQSIATQIVNEYPQSPLFVSLLRGAAPFTSLLMFEIARQNPDYHPELDYMMVRTYGNGKHAGDPKIITDINPSTLLEGRSVIIIDDVLDKGITADFVIKHLKDRGASEVKLAVLCDKQVAREKSVEADYKGFSFGDNWLVGMGMDGGDTTEAYRWLDEIWEVTE